MRRTLPLLVAKGVTLLLPLILPLFPAVLALVPAGQHCSPRLYRQLTLLGSRRGFTSSKKVTPPVAAPKLVTEVKTAPSPAAAADLTQTEVTLSRVAAAVEAAAPTIVDGLRGKGWVFIDNFLSDAFCSTLRQEAVGLYNSGRFEKSQSTRWCSVKNEQVYYDKHNVFSMQLNGGDDYFAAPRLHEYTVSLIRNIVPFLHEAFPEAMLCDRLASNKLAVCTGDGSAYDKHYDNSGLDDVRKVTVLYYMNSDWREENGGSFRIYNPSGSASEFTDVQPRGDRLLCFWSDVLVHSVQPSFAQLGEGDHRYALTVWLTATSPEAIRRDDDEVKRHFELMD